MVKEGEPGMVARLVHALEVAHESVVAPIVDGGTGSEKCLQTGIVEGQQFLEGVVAPLEKGHVRVHGVAGDAKGGPDLTVAVTVQVQCDDLF